ncbi:aminotransferase classes i and ii family protein [Anaeramoeba ignava]|uniref:Aminotransferase classes i and ii family protein n=1 Tax=Anaeramoeba ignava TaxID=1746090 RepID=A0A9Q0L7N4_ANAIG|nr:aminotransferase classes i and ii family protein [Anaeramoeba ignava]|eukprot:Anaeramoba_ignava/a92271_40.p1 GENE.a92271_40~~a92271_40.p1  ORF type:complete len:413 (+),score=146.27 a92271_40:13-1251(+)
MTTSKRSERYLNKKAHPLQIGARMCFENPYDKETNPNGYINLGTAENHIVFDLMEKKLKNREKLPKYSLKYGQAFGHPDLLKATAQLYHDHLFIKDVKPEQLVFAAGCGGGALDILFNAVCDEGDSVLIPVPYYGGFTFDLFRSKVKIHPCPNFLQIVKGEVEFDPIKEGIKAVLITTPDNPQGNALTEETLTEYINWSQKYNLHIIFDEIYACSVYKPTSKFTSGMSIKCEKPELVHQAYGMSKDFAMSGWRIGVIFTRNKNVLKISKELSFYSSVSGDTQWILTDFLSDIEWRDNFIKTNKERLYHNYQLLTKIFDDHKIKHLPCDGAFFLMVDLREFLKDQSKQAELDLYNHILKETNVQILPAMQGFEHVVPGFYRICFAVDEEVLTLAGNRIAKAVESFQNLTEKKD